MKEYKAYKYGQNVYISYDYDKSVERKGENDLVNFCEGYSCTVYSDPNAENEIDSFTLAVGYEIPNLSDNSLEEGINDFLGNERTPILKIKDKKRDTEIEITARYIDIKYLKSEYNEYIEYYDIYAEMPVIKENGKEKSEFGESWSGVAHNANDYLIYAVSCYVNNESNFELIYADPSITEIYNYINREKVVDNINAKYLYTSGDILSIECVTLDYDCYSNGERFAAIDRDTKSLVTDYENFYQSICYQAFSEPSDDIIYANEYFKEFIKDIATKGEVKCKLSCFDNENPLKETDRENT